MRTYVFVLSTMAFGLALSVRAADEPPPRAETSQDAVSEDGASAHVNRGDRQFLQMAIDTGAKELQVSQRAQNKAQADSVKEFARLMVEDHSKLNRELLELSEKVLAGGGPPYKRANAAVKREIDALDKLKGEAFDRRYMELMVKDHESAVKLFSRQAQHGKDMQLRTLAEKTLPTLRRHLEMAREIVEK